MAKSTFEQFKLHMDGVREVRAKIEKDIERLRTEYASEMKNEKPSRSNLTRIKNLAEVYKKKRDNIDIHIENGDKVILNWWFTTDEAIQEFTNEKFN